MTLDGKPAASSRRRLTSSTSTTTVRRRTGSFRHGQQFALVMNVYSSADFVFNVPYEFTDRFAGQKDFFSSELKPGEMEDPRCLFLT